MIDLLELECKPLGLPGKVTLPLSLPSREGIKEKTERDGKF
jgi:hypothetical protein